MSDIKASIIICTHNRATYLADTLASFRALAVPSHLATELIVVDNASTDDTEAVASGMTFDNLEFRYLRERRRGQCHARNRGLAAAKGQVILFTDDDVRVPSNWVEGMCEPILSGRADGVAGGVVIARQLIRPWMTQVHRTWFASSENLNSERPSWLIGANMAFSRAVLERVPQFDPELGPGALGFGDEVLFAAQLQKAGYRIVGALNHEVEHHFAEERLLRTNLLVAAKMRGRSKAYSLHHWHHGKISFVRARMLSAALRLRLLRLLRRQDCRVDEGCAVWELEFTRALAFYQHYLVEKQRPRNYRRFGLRRQEDRQTEAVERAWPSVPR